MKKLKRKIIFPLFVSLGLSAYFLFIIILTERYNEMWFAAIPLAIFPLCILINVIQEKYADKKAEKRAAEKASIPESSIRQQVLENYGGNVFREITAETMADDLKEICRKKYAPRWLIVTAAVLLFLLLSIWIFYAERDFSSVCLMVFLIILTCGCFAMFVYAFSGLSVKVFTKQAGNNLNCIERSYMGGKTICATVHTLNIGIDYCVCTDLFGIGFFRNSDIQKVVLIEKRTKEYDRSGFYAGEKNELYISFIIKDEKRPYDIHGTQLQIEYICDELMRCGIKIIK